MLPGAIKSSLETYYLRATEESGKGSYDRMIKTIVRGLSETDPFKQMGREMSNHLYKLKKELDQATKDWCRGFDRELEKIVRGWTRRSEAAGQLEIDEKEKLGDIVSQYGQIQDELVEEAKRLELEAKT
ncbi:hypothetical protein TWF481_003824 [Arthrobotrys musiformis]|uniref:Uncharacterized protein n=1 Tax=Arthrobotrys musiformis TaxID=47236 RepID=A0AAV9WI80_9PEZI